MNLPPISTNQRKGQPLVVLSGVLACWTGVRVLAWTFGAASPDAAIAGADAVTPAIPAQIAARHAAVVSPKQAVRDMDQAFLAPSPAMPLAPAQQSPVELAPSPLAPAALPMSAPVTPQVLEPARPRPNPTMAGGHQLMFMAALSMLPMPPELMQRRDSNERSPAALAPRWSADGWVLLRRDSGLASLASSGGSYGASQIGAVLRYRLDRTSASKPSLYLRTSAALNGTREQDAAFGLSLRPIGNVPVLALAEARVTRNALGTRVRPAAFVVTELPTAKLPLGLRGEAYVQAGYVGGKGASAFVDGQARIDARLFQMGKAEMRAGGAAWGGAQQGASRLDVGPSASLSFRLDDTVGARVSADWRFRVGGRAAPSSGPALTLSAGF